jgi:hypothetical protein
MISSSPISISSSEDEPELPDEEEEDDLASGYYSI